MPEATTEVAGKKPPPDPATVWYRERPGGERYGPYPLLVVARWYEHHQLPPGAQMRVEGGEGEEEWMAVGAALAHAGRVSGVRATGEALAALREGVAAARLHLARLESVLQAVTAEEALLHQLRSMEQKLEGDWNGEGDEETGVESEGEEEEVGEDANKEGEDVASKKEEKEECVKAWPSVEVTAPTNGASVDDSLAAATLARVLSRGGRVQQQPLEVLESPPRAEEPSSDEEAYDGGENLYEIMMQRRGKRALFRMLSEYFPAKTNHPKGIRGKRMDRTLVTHRYRKLYLTDAGKRRMRDARSRLKQNWKMRPKLRLMKKKAEEAEPAAKLRRIKMGRAEKRAALEAAAKAAGKKEKQREARREVDEAQYDSDESWCSDYGRPSKSARLPAGVPAPLSLLYYRKSAPDACVDLCASLVAMRRLFDKCRREQRRITKANVQELFDKPLHCAMCCRSRTTRRSQKMAEMYPPLSAPPTAAAAGVGSGALITRPSQLLHHITRRSHVIRATANGGTASAAAVEMWMNVLRAAEIQR